MTDDLNALIDPEVGVVEETETNETPVTADSENEAPSWVLPLRGSNADDRHFVEFARHEYQFDEIMDPDGNPSGKFAVFYRDLARSPENRRWETLKGMLSGLYTIAKAQEFYAAIHSQMRFAEDPVVAGSPFTLVCSNKTNQSINMFNDEAMKTIFCLVTGIDENVLNTTRSRVSLSIVNTYDGTRSIHTDYVIDTVVNGLEMRDYFILANHSHTFAHITHSLGSVSADVANVQDYYNSAITVLKNHTAGIDNIVSNICKRMKKIARNQMNSYWESMPAENKNLLFALVLASHCLHNNYDVNQHKDLRGYIGNVVNSVFASAE